MLYLCRANMIAKNRMRYFIIPIISLLALLTGSCSRQQRSAHLPEVVFQNASYPHVLVWQGNYYATTQPRQGDSILLYTSSDPYLLAQGRSRCVWHDRQMQHIWSPELHRLNSKWYLYFEADDGNTDNHQLYVLENSSDNPMQGEFKLKGGIKTNEEWNFGLHPTSIVVRGQQYLIWSGWQHRRSETETQCIFIARMQNPWTLESERVLLSQPELEWERQWINPDGLRSNYPIFVNENPEAFLTDDGRHICVCYSASGIWTVYHVMGMLTAPSDANLLDIRSWSKSQEPIYIGSTSRNDSIYGCSNISLVPAADKTGYLLFYESMSIDDDGTQHRDIRMRPLTWSDDGMPDFSK